MPNISDIIEGFLIETLGGGKEMSICRNELASYFSCAPSQINYVLSTRFTRDRGFIIESKRGGGGSVLIARITESPDSFLSALLRHNVSEGISALRAGQIIDRMQRERLIGESEYRLLGCLLSDKSLLAPAVAKDGLRAGMLRAVAEELLRRNQN